MKEIKIKSTMIFLKEQREKNRKEGNDFEYYQRYLRNKEKYDKKKREYLEYIKEINNKKEKERDKIENIEKYSNTNRKEENDKKAHEEEFHNKLKLNNELKQDGKIIEKRFPLIIIDERERGLIRKQFLLKQKKEKCSIKIETLPLGDYILAPDVIVERKRGDDFISSLLDTRLFHQLQKIKKEFKRPILLIEEPLMIFTKVGVKRASIWGAISSIQQQLGISIIYSKNAQQSANILISLAKRLQLLTNSFDLMKNFNIHKKIGNIRKGVTINREKQIYFLEGLIGIRKSKAIKLIDKYKTPIEVLNIIEKYSNKDFKDLNWFGKKIIAKNKELLNKPFKID